MTKPWIVWLCTDCMPAHLGRLRTERAPEKACDNCAASNEALQPTTLDQIERWIRRLQERVVVRMTGDASDR